MTQQKENMFEFGAQLLLYIFTALLPVWIVPGYMGVDFGREITFAALIIAAFGLLLVSVLMRAEIRYPRSWILYSALLMAAAFGVSAFFSRAPFVSLAFAAPVAERLSTLILGIVLMILAAVTIRMRQEAGILLNLLFASSTLSALIALVQMVSGFSLYAIFGSGLGAAVDFNVVGTINGLALFYVAVLATELGVLFFTGRDMQKWNRYFLVASSLLLAADIILINFWTAWIVLFGAGVVFLGLLLKNARFNAAAPEERSAASSGEEPEEGNMPLHAKDGRFSALAERQDGPNAAATMFARLGWRYPAVLFLIAFSIFMIVARRSFVNLDFASEVSPTFGKTLSIGGSVLAESVRAFFFGSGPGTFGLDWMRHKDASINQTPFWGVRFNQGSSWVSTLVATLGITGTILFLCFVGITGFLFLRAILLSGEEIHFREGVFFGFFALAAAAFFYPANATLLFLLFLLIGVEIALLKKPVSAEMFFDGVREEARAFAFASVSGAYPQSEEPDGDGETAVKEEAALVVQEADTVPLRKEDICEYRIEFRTPWSMFLSSLAVVFLLFAAFWAFYFEIGRAQAAFIQNRGLALLQRGDVDKAVLKFQEAIGHETSNYMNYQLAAQAGMQKIQALVQKASKGENVQQDFQSTFVAASQFAKTATEKFPEEPSVWRTQGALYELVIPYIDGAERLAIANYQKAAELDRLNPSLYVDMARAGMLFAERVAFAANQRERGEELEKLRQLYTDTLRQVADVLQKGIDLKEDYAEAHFMRAQTALRLGNLKDAIASTESAKRASPLDIGIAFQLGLLYYQDNNLEQAKAEFERAVSINPDYSNARYFLGLINDRKGEKAVAITEFEAIQKLNPDNEEVKKILENLRNGKPALDQIVPPAQPPEKRAQAPVKEAGQKK